MSNRIMLDRAQSMRKAPTGAERIMWALLRNRRLCGHKFRRQFPVGPYIVDFVCLSHRLIVELDGSQHLGQADYDAARSRWLEGQGFRAIRFWNDDVLRRKSAVAEQILRELGQQ